MPLFRVCDNPIWLTVGEVIAFITQIFEASETPHCQPSGFLHDLSLQGTQFMHEHHFAHKYSPSSAAMLLRSCAITGISTSATYCMTPDHIPEHVPSRRPQESSRLERFREAFYTNATSSQILLH